MLNLVTDKLSDDHLRMPWQQLVLLIVIQLLGGSTGEVRPDYSTNGPCTPLKHILNPIILPQDSGCGSYCTLHPRLHVPGLPETTAADGNGRCTAAPYPVVAFFSGFQLSSSYYSFYARRLASWGFAVVQYDLALLHIVADELELGYFSHLLGYLRTEANTSRLLDLARIGTAGHSRGGKLAALHLAGNSAVLAAFLVDPVDSANPSAVEGLTGKAKQAAIAAAGLSGPCNPLGRNFQEFYDVLAAGSWLEVVPVGGHMQFANISSGVIARALDWVCHSGHTTHEHVMQLAAPPLVAWMDASLRTSNATATTVPAAAAAAAFMTRGHSSRKAGVWQHRNTQATNQAVGSLQAFFEWVEQEKSAGEITFEVKENQPTAAW